MSAILAVRLAASSLFGLVALALAPPSWGQVWTGQAPRESEPTNVLIVVLDDTGIDMVGAYGASPDCPPTPTIDRLAHKGVLFTHAYSQPVCSPTRATLMTGRYGFRTRVGVQIPVESNDFGLPLEELTFAEVLGQIGYASIATSAIGKWNLGSYANGGAANANLQGFQWFSGTLGNLGDESYFAYTKYVNGVPFANSNYATTEQVDDALARIDTMPQPWCLYLAFNAAHFPLHAPPQALHTYALSGDPELSKGPHFRAAMQAVDTELGRLLTTMPAAVLDATTILLLGDNGTPGPVVTAPFDLHRSKGTLYEGGVHVPLIAWGKRVSSPGRVCDALVNTVDVFPTVLDLFRDQAEISLPKTLVVDGVSLLPYLVDPEQRPQRKWVYADYFSPNGPGPYTLSQRMLRDARWKLLEIADNDDEFYDLGTNLLEGEDLLLGPFDAEQAAAYARLKLTLQQLTQN